MRAVLFSLLCACATTAPAASPAPQPPGPAKADLAKVQVAVAPETVVNDPVMKDRGAELREALGKALADEGFKVGEPAPGSLTLTTSIDYTPGTNLQAMSLFIVVGLKKDGESVDQVEVQKINEAFPEPAKVGELAHGLAHSLAVSPRLRDFLNPK